MTGDAKAGKADIVALPEWHYDALYDDGWSAEELIDEAEVYGSEGEEIGDVENILVSDKGKILALVVEMGGFVDLGDTHIMVPWDKVDLSPDLERIDVPVDQENAEEYSMYGGLSFITKPESKEKQVVYEDIATGARVWQVSELLDDYAVLNGGGGYGYVDDAIFNQQGQLQAVVVSPDFAYGPGPYAYPFYGYASGFEPGLPYYSLNYSESDVAEMQPFDEEKLQDKS